MFTQENDVYSLNGIFFVFFHCCKEAKFLRNIVQLPNQKEGVASMANEANMRVKTHKLFTGVNINVAQLVNQVKQLCKQWLTWLFYNIA